MVSDPERTPNARMHPENNTLPSSKDSQPGSASNETLKELEQPSYDSKITIQALLWVYDVAGDKAADSLIEVMSTMCFDWGLEFSSGDKKAMASEVVEQIIRQRANITLLASGHGNEQLHQSIRLYKMTARRIEILSHFIQPNEYENASIIMDRSVVVFANLCPQMSILLNARGILGNIWDQNYHRLFGNACAGIVTAELKLMFLISSCLNEPSKWKTPNDTMKFHRGSFREVITFYNSTIARTAIQLARHSDGDSPLNVSKLTGLMDAITQSTNCIVGLISNIPSRPIWYSASDFREYGATRPGITVESQRDVALENGPLTITIPSGDAARTKFVLYPIDYGLSRELARILFSSTEQQLESSVLNKVDHALRSILEVLFNRAGDTSSLPILHDAGTLDPYWHQDLKFISILSTHNTRQTNERQALCDEIFGLYPWLPVPNKTLEEQMAGQLLTIATLYTLHSGPSRKFKSFRAATEILQIAGRFEQQTGLTGWPRPDMWRLIRAVNVQGVVSQGTCSDFQRHLLAFVSNHMLRLDIQTPGELNLILSLLANQKIESEWEIWGLGVTTVLESLTDTPGGRSLIHEYCFHTLDGFPSLLLIAHNVMVRKPVVNFVVSITHMATHETQGSDSPRQLGTRALDSFLLPINFILLASTPPASPQIIPSAKQSTTPAPTLSNLEQQSFARDALSLLADHDVSPLDNNPEEQDRVHKGLLYVWGKISGENSEPPDLSLASVKRRLQEIVNTPIQEAEVLEERAGAGGSDSNARPGPVGSDGKGEYRRSWRAHVRFELWNEMGTTN
ncbi:hypothetical protein FRC11_004601 [Ceratobasidium sp. 423]|nr:hypothetical protein FRC11_004601 [Ceratobasidium sp. 423]